MGGRLCMECGWLSTEWAQGMAEEQTLPKANQDPQPACQPATQPATSSLEGAGQGCTSVDALLKVTQARGNILSQRVNQTAKGAARDAPQWMRC